ncbi:P-loop containing nucleoside triphosphate hydrolase protein [Chiua virens]|nr:P-loop containing nucleoside triphosphate hydrolase protein [Chiua virens]
MIKDRFKADPNDFIIVLMGPTGSGKTNFINNITGNTEQRKASHLKSDTQDVTPYMTMRDGRRIVLVDTPGFDDTYRPDTDILKTIADWLIQKYATGGTLKLNGIIYLHRITDNRMTGSAYKNLQMFGQLCGDIPLPRVHLVTTMWDIVKDKNMAERREAELKREFWKQLLDGGASAFKFNNLPQSAQVIIDPLLDATKGREELLLQEELVEQQKNLNETAAAKVLYSRLQKLLAEQKKMLKDLADQADARNDPALAQSLQEEYEKINAQLQKTFEEMKEMKIPFTRRIMLWFFGRKSRVRAINLANAPA